MTALSARLNEPQTIAKSELWTTYHYANRFDPHTAKAIGEVFGKAAPLLTFNHICKPSLCRYDYLCQTDYLHTCPNRNNIPKELQELDNAWSFPLPPGIRATIGTHSKLPSLLFKFFIQHHPRSYVLCTSLRAAMADRIDQVIREKGLDQVRVPTKGIVPLFSTHYIEQLDDTCLNNALVTVAKKIEIIPHLEMISTIQGYSADKQRLLANQLCTVLAETGIGDFVWPNFGMHDDIVYILDSEPLYNELTIVPNFPAQKSSDSAPTLRTCALAGLERFARSSNREELPIFVETANEWIEKLTL